MLRGPEFLLRGKFACLEGVKASELERELGQACHVALKTFVPVMNEMTLLTGQTGRVCTYNLFCISITGGKKNAFLCFQLDI